MPHPLTYCGNLLRSLSISAIWHYEGIPLRMAHLADESCEICKHVLSLTAANLAGIRERGEGSARCQVPHALAGETCFLTQGGHTLAVPPHSTGHLRAPVAPALMMCARCVPAGAPCHAGGPGGQRDQRAAVCAVSQAYDGCPVLADLLQAGRQIPARGGDRSQL